MFATLQELYPEKKFVHPEEVIEKEYNINEPKKFMYKDTQFNNHYAKLAIDNYRLQKYTHNKNYLFKKDQLYDLIDINDGKGPGKNPDVDSTLTRGNFITKPIDKLAEKTNWERQRKEILNTVTPRNEYYHNDFLVSTTISDNPEVNFNPGLRLRGINTRHYVRKDDDYYRNL